MRAGQEDGLYRTEEMDERLAVCLLITQIILLDDHNSRSSSGPSDLLSPSAHITAQLSFTSSAYTTSDMLSAGARF